MGGIIDKKATTLAPQVVLALGHLCQETTPLPGENQGQMQLIWLAWTVSRKIALTF